jgi:hypothetical protein
MTAPAAIPTRTVATYGWGVPPARRKGILAAAEAHAAKCGGTVVVDGEKINVVALAAPAFGPRIGREVQGDAKALKHWSTRLALLVADGVQIGDLAEITDLTAAIATVSQRISDRAAASATAARRLTARV